MSHHATPDCDSFDVNDALIIDLLQLKAVLATMGHLFGGECPRDERPTDLQLCLVMQWASKTGERAYRLASESPSMDEAVTGELMEMSALLLLMDATHSALDMRIAFSDEIMDGYLDAMIRCAQRALETINPGLFRCPPPLNASGAAAPPAC